MAGRHVFVTGATGCVGSRLAPALLGGGARVTALAREESRYKVPAGCEVAIGNALNGSSYRDLLSGADTFIQLVGVAHPGPGKAREFVEIDLKAGLEAVAVAKDAGISHFIYVSVAHPAPAMKAYIDVRTRCELAIGESGLNSTILRPWYVLGPGHRWPYLLFPFYKAAEMWPSTRDSARRLGLVSLEQMVRALAAAVDHPPVGVRVFDVPAIRAGGLPG